MKNKKDTFGINMIEYIKNHEEYIYNELENNCDIEKLYKYNKIKLKWFQHERFVHLMVTLFTVGLFVYLITNINIGKSPIIIYVVIIINFVVSIAYIVHYFKLENSIQHFYKVSDEIKSKIE
jgi:hypothetical protein